MSASLPMKYCEFDVQPSARRRGWFVFTCKYCGKVAHAPSSAKMMAMCGKPRPLKERCAHRSELPIRVDECKTCCGKVRIKIFECGILGECTITTCQNCEHHKNF